MSWWKFFLPKRASGSQLDSELRFHIDELIEVNITSGMSPEEARRRAMLEFGGQEQVKEEVRDVYRVWVIDSTIANLKSAIRFIRKSPSFSGTVILTLALGIGANSTVFSAIDAILLRPLPFPQGDQLMLLRQYNLKEKSPQTFVAPVRLEDWNRMTSVFQAISGYYTEDDPETSGALPEKLTHAFVAPRFLQVLGVSPILGREFKPDEERFGGPRAVLISYRLWQRRFGGDPNTLGKTLGFEGYSQQIVGVMPAAFAFPDRSIDLWSPVPPDAPYAQSRENTWYTVIGRLKPGVGVNEARPDISHAQSQLGEQFPKTDASLAVKVLQLKDNIVDSSRRSLLVLFGSVTLLLLIACMNIAALLLARMTEREHEISVRFSLALGALREQIVRQFVLQGLRVTLLGCLAGWGLAMALTRVLSGMLYGVSPTDAVTLSAVIVQVLIVAALAALIPSFRAARVDPMDVLREE